MMRDEVLFAAFAATYLAEFCWLKAANKIVAPHGFHGPNRQATLSAARRAQVYARDAGICSLCRLPVDAACHVGPGACTIDHIRPLSQGGARHALANLVLAHEQCNLLKSWSPHPTTLYTRDQWRCRRCRELVSHDDQQHDWHWNRPIVERLVPLDSPAIWWLGRAWCCHLRCHAYHLPIPPIDGVASIHRTIGSRK